jgi:hypothetical protein
MDRCGFLEKREESLGMPGRHERSVSYRGGNGRRAGHQHESERDHGGKSIGASQFPRSHVARRLRTRRQWPRHRFPAAEFGLNGA